MTDNKSRVEILIVEDSATQAEGLKYTLERHGFGVSSARNGLEALGAMRKKMPDLVISDIIMPEMDGFELCGRMKNEPSMKGLPLILLTALSDAADVLRGLECGADSFITKPYDEKYLLARIDHILANVKLRGKPGTHRGVEIIFNGHTYSINSDREQILDLLISTYETAVMKNQELEETRAKLETLNERLSVRTTQLEDAVKDLESFSYSISHDLKAPLRAINGFSQMLGDSCGEKLGEEGNRLLAVVRKNALHMGQLIDDILAFSRAGRKELQLTRINMPEMVKTVITELQHLTEGRDVIFKVGDFPDAVGDAAAIRQVLQNLLSNAVKFTRHREHAQIELGCTVSGSVNAYFVRDNGAGFNAEYADKLFGVFRRLHGADEFEGTGIGLAIVKRFINKLGGRVWAEGKINEGATFYFTLPNK